MADDDSDHRAVEVIASVHSPGIDAETTPRDLEFYRGEAHRLGLRVEELKSSLGYRLSAPVRWIEKLTGSLHKRSVADNLRKLVGRLPEKSESARSRPLEVPHPLNRSGIDDAHYQLWVTLYDSPSDADRAPMQSDIANFDRRPLVSILLMPSDRGQNPDASLLSLVNQAYPDLQIVMAVEQDVVHVAGPPRNDPIDDERIQRIAIGPGQRGSQIFNQLWESIRGEYVVAIDAGDLLPVSAIYMFVREVLKDPKVEIVYADEDECGADGRRRDPFFKPDWDQELALGVNYPGVAVFYSASRLRQVRHALTTGDAWRWDLLLRASQGLGMDRIRHIPFVLCHQSALATLRRQAELDAGVQAVDVAGREGETALVSALEAESPSIVSAAAGAWPSVTIIVATRDRSDLLRTCMAGLLHRTQYPDIQVLVIDNQSSDPATFEYFNQLRSDRRVTILPYPEPFNYSAIHNFAVARATGEIIAMVNNDIDVIEPQWLSTMVAHARDATVGAVGAKLLYPVNTVQHAGVVLGFGGSGADHIFRGIGRHDPGPWGLAHLAQEFSAVTGACLVMRRSVYLEVGGMNENLVVEFNDVDLCLRVREAGYRVVWTPRALLYHLESATRGTHHDEHRHDLRHFAERWKSVIRADPYYNPNLAFAFNRTLAFPPRIRPPWAAPASSLDSASTEEGRIPTPTPMP